MDILKRVKEELRKGESDIVWTLVNILLRMKNELRKGEEGYFSLFGLVWKY